MQKSPNLLFLISIPLTSDPLEWLMMRQTEVMRSARESESHITTGTVLLTRVPGLEVCSSRAMVTTSTWDHIRIKVRRCLGDSLSTENSTLSSP